MTLMQCKPRSPQGGFKDVERVLLYSQTSTSKLIDPPLCHIKGKSVMKACWTVCQGCAQDELRGGYLPAKVVQIAGKCSISGLLCSDYSVKPA